MRIALLGAGRMATEIGRHVLTAGHEVVVWNRTAERTGALVRAGARAADTAADAVTGADVAVSVLFGPQSVRETLINPNLLTAGDVWLDVTTVGPEDAVFHASWAEHKQVRYVAGPVLGSLAPARAGALGSLLGGAPDDVARVRELVSLWTDGAKLRELPSAREAAAGKLVANLALGVAMQGISEALTYAGDVGLDRDIALDVLSGSVVARLFGSTESKLREHDFYDADFTASALIKDLDLILGDGLGLHAVQAARDVLETAIEDGRGDEDFSVLADV